MPSYIIWLEWPGGRISFIRDDRYVRYIVADAELALDAKRRLSPASTAATTRSRKSIPQGRAMQAGLHPAHILNHDPLTNGILDSIKTEQALVSRFRSSQALVAGSDELRNR